LLCFAANKILWWLDLPYGYFPDILACYIKVEGCIAGTVGTLRDIAMISIVIPALNEEKFLPECLVSLRSQSYAGEYEIIVVDNSSTDETASIARDFGAKVVPCPDRRSVFYARQVGAEAARGYIIAQADADTVYPEDWLERIAGQLTLYPEAVAIAGRYFYKSSPYWARLEYFFKNWINRITALLFGRPVLVSGATLAFRRREFLLGDGYRGLRCSPDQFGIVTRLSRMGRVLYDKNLYVRTSSRRVQKPFFLVLVDIVDNAAGLSLYFFRYCLSSISGLSVRPLLRLATTRLVPASTVIVLLVFAYGFFVPSAQVFGKVYYEGDPSEKVIALTFDDGPNEPYTSEILDILARYNVQATFFVIGRNVELYPETAGRIIAEGHVLGNHSYSHDVLQALTQDNYDDLEKAQETIFEASGVRPHLYRPPHGAKTPWELKDAEKLGMVAVTWSVSTTELDGETIIGMPSPEAGAADIVTKVESGGIILLYDGDGVSHGEAGSNQGLTVAALPLIIEQLRSQEYRFVTVPELLRVPAYND
jgi:peptidoglycan/xylan/chitin deacetylase (PgdA/CDA1 family)